VDYIGRLQLLAKQLNAAGATTTDKDLVPIALTHLKEDFEIDIRITEHKPEDSITLELILQTLTQTEHERGQDLSSKALYSRSVETPKSKKVCLNCLGNSHTKNNCKKERVSKETLEESKMKVFGRNYKPLNSRSKQGGHGNNSNGPGNNQSKMAYVLNVSKLTTSQQSSTIFLDSGASHHHTGDLSRLSNYNESSPSHKLSGISSELVIKGSGSMTIHTFYNGTEREHISGCVLCSSNAGYTNFSWSTKEKRRLS
jgi:hypothetical protein